MKGVRRALVSVSDKTGLIPFAQGLVELSFEIVSTGGTARALRDAGVAVTDVSSLTSFPEIMDGRVKTLHPAVHAGLLARRGVDEAVLEAHGIGWIDLLVVNLYPFEAVIRRENTSETEAIENIDVGGPAMLRAAAKNHARMTVVVDANDYPRVLDALRAGEPPDALRRELAVKAFAHTARYDALIAGYLGGSADLPDPLVLAFERIEALRYGENPHQKAALYRSLAAGSPGFRQLQGKAPSFNNLVDADAAFACARDFDECACVIVKHANPCGAALGANPATAYERAYATDPTSAFGGVIAFNRPVDRAAAEAIVSRQFVDVVIAPAIDEAAAAVFAKKPAVRILETGSMQSPPQLDLRVTWAGLLVQQQDTEDTPEREWRCVTRRSPTESELRDLRFAWTTVRHVKSNAIVFARDQATIGIGAGQTSRVMSARIAALKAKDEHLPIEGAVMASDAFFPFRDGVDVAASEGIRAVIQPGGSMRDEEVIRAADEHGVAMLLTGTRHFRH